MILSTSSYCVTFHVFKDELLQKSRKEKKNILSRKVIINWKYSILFFSLCDRWVLNVYFHDCNPFLKQQQFLLTVYQTLFCIQVIPRLWFTWSRWTSASAWWPCRQPSTTPDWSSASWPWSSWESSPSIACIYSYDNYMYCTFILSQKIVFTYVKM